MFQFLHKRPFHYLFLAGLMAVITLPNLSVQSLWDMDEAVNAKASREMLEAGTWVKPTFNFELRTAKPVMLYWLQMTSYRLFGVSEIAARVPSVLAGFFTVLLTYELGRRMFSASTGLLAGTVLASAIYFCLTSHAATPDSTLLLFTMITYTVFWFRSANGSKSWFLPCGAACGLAFLTKGPVGVVLPVFTIGLYLLWNREIAKLWDRRMFAAFGVFILVGAPWFVLIGVETHGEFVKKFFLAENIDRFREAKEHHDGWMLLYYPLTLLLFFAPWSIFLGGSIWDAVRDARAKVTDIQAAEIETADQGRRAYRLLLCWIVSYLLFFSLAATKLPNYVLPVYPALALVTARFLDRWRLGLFAPARWLMPTAICALGAVGIITIAGLVIAGGAIHLPIKEFQVFPGLTRWAFLGVIPLAGALAAFWYWHRNARSGVVVSIGVASVGFVATLAALPVVEMDHYKAPRSLTAMANMCQPDREIRIGALGWYEPSTVFYTRREVKEMKTMQSAVDFLNAATPVYLFVAEDLWEELSQKLPKPLHVRTAARHYDFLKRCNVIVVTNDNVSATP